MENASLLYGIVFAEPGARGSWLTGLPPGVGGAPVNVIEEAGLGAAVSTVERSDLTPNISRALSYARVVEAIHARRTVLPMRYGSLFGDERQVVELLRVHREEYAGLLHALDGCVEMGVRALVDSGEARVPDAESLSSLPGATYLAGRRVVYAEAERRARDEGRLIERCREAFAGLFVQCRAERPLARASDVAVHFLVTRTAVEDFRRAFERTARTDAARLLLSGPWPPYNFAAPEREGNEHG